MHKRLALTLLIVSLSLQAQTSVSGSVSGVWSAENAPYQLTGNVVVEINDTLIIHPQTVIDFGGQYELRVRGQLLADSSTFINGGEVFGEHGHVVITNSYFRNFVEGLGFYGGSAHIHSSTIMDTEETAITFSGVDTASVVSSTVKNSGDYGIKLVQNDAVSILNNHLTGNSTSDTNHPALFIDSCSPTEISGNIIEDNHAQGVGVWTLTTTAAPRITNNIIRRNFTGMTLVNAPAHVEGNIIVANYQEGNANSGAGIYAGYPSSTGVVMNNYIAGNYYGVSNINSAALNMGDMVNDYPGDDGMNIIIDNSYDGTTWNIWNGTSNTLMAQNNYWPGMTSAEIDAAIYDNEEGGGEVLTEPSYLEALPVPPDVNSDTQVNVLDVVQVIESILSGTFDDHITFYLSDMNQDYDVDINDVVFLVELIVEG